MKSTWSELVSFLRRTRVGDLVTTSRPLFTGNVLWLYALGLALVLGCGQVVKFGPATTLCEDYFRMRDSAPPDQLMSLYSEEFFKATPKAEMLKELEKYKAELGPHEKHELVGGGVGKTVSVLHQNDEITLTYNVQYLHRSVTETFKVVTSSNGKGARIKTHNITWPEESK